MVYGGFPGGPGFGWGGLGFGGPGPGGEFGGCGAGWGGPGFGGHHGEHHCGPGVGGHHFGHERAVFGTLALLLDGPANAAQIVQRTSEITGGALEPPQEIAELAIGVLAGRGLVTVENGVATLSELGRNLLAWRGVSSETAHAFLARAAQFGDGIRIYWRMQELRGLARRIFWSGTDEQKAKLAEVRTEVLAALRKAAKTLHGVLAES